MSCTGGITHIESGQKKDVVSDYDSQDILRSILKELKIMNLHLSLLTDSTIRKEEVE